MSVGNDWTGAGEDAGEEIGANVLVGGTGLAVFCSVFVGCTRVGTGLTVLAGSV